jgi:hypothetical protein
MNVTLSRVSMRLGRRHWLQLVDAVGMTINCVDGCLWITQHRDTRDFVVGPSESFVLDRPGLAVIQALTESNVEIEEPAAASSAPVRITGLLKVKSRFAWPKLSSPSARSADAGTMACRA